MRALVEFLLKEIVKYPDKVSIDVKEDEKSVLIVVNVDDEDIGRVIGRRGRMVRSLTQLLRIKGAIMGKRVVMRVEGSRSNRDRESSGYKYKGKQRNYKGID